MDGIGDTLRVSLAADPVHEIKVGFDILRSLKLRNKGINFIACPSCSRQNFDVVLTPLDVSVIGCVVNGPGEAKETDLGLTGGSPNNLLYVDGVPASKLGNEGLVDNLEKLIRDKVAQKEAREADLIVKA